MMTPAFAVEHARAVMAERLAEAQRERLLREALLARRAARAARVTSGGRPPRPLSTLAWLVAVLLRALGTGLLRSADAVERALASGPSAPAVTLHRERLA